MAFMVSMMRLIRRAGEVGGWLPSIWYRSALLGGILIGLVWVSVDLFLKNERNSAEQAAIQNAMNLAGAFEEHLSRSLAEIDRSLKLVRTQYGRDRDKFDLINWLRNAQLFNDEVLQVSIVDRSGHVKLSSVDAAAFRGLDISDREHFRVHVDARGDELFISKPVVGRTTGKSSIQLTRRIANDDGTFGGVVIASLDPAYLTRIYNAVNTGVDGYIRVIGVDGIVRATSGRSPSVLGGDWSSADLFKRYPAESSGWYFVGSTLSDHIPRLVTFRAVKNYPLIITVGLSTHEIFSRLEAERRVGYAVAAVLTLLIISVTAFSIRGQLLRENANKHLERTNMLLNATLANMPHGV
jgi:hypothetical protein